MMKKLFVKVIIWIVISVLFLVLSACGINQDTEWEFDQNLYETPMFYTITYATEYDGIESMRLNEDSIVGVNHYFNGYYVIEDNPGLYYHWTDQGVLYEISLEDSVYVCTELIEYDEEVHVRIEDFEDALFTAEYETRGDFPYRYTISVGETDPYIEFFDKSYSTLDFDFRYPEGIYYYSIQFTSSSPYTSLGVEYDCYE